MTFKERVTTPINTDILEELIEAEHSNNAFLNKSNANRTPGNVWQSAQKYAAKAGRATNAAYLKHQRKQAQSSYLEPEAAKKADGNVKDDFKKAYHEKLNNVASSNRRIADNPMHKTVGDMTPPLKYTIPAALLGMYALSGDTPDIEVPEPEIVTEPGTFDQNDMYKAAGGAALAGAGGAYLINKLRKSNS